MIIKRYKDFILEKMGVPSGIVESAGRLYDKILTSFSVNKNVELHPDPGTNQLSLSVDFGIDIEINDLKFDKIHFKISFQFGDVDKVDVTHWGVMVPPSGQENYAILYDYDSIQNLVLNCNFVVNPGDTMGDLANFLVDEKSQNIAVLSHELKHIYDKYKFGKEFISEIADYATFANERTGFPPVDEFIYFVYVVSNSENLVRPSEVAAQLQTLDISKSEFKEFLESTTIYKDLIKIKKFTFQGLKDELMNDMPIIRKVINGIPDDEPNENIVNFILTNTAEAIIKSQSDKLKDILGLENIMRVVAGKVTEEDYKYYKKYLTKRFFEKNEEFFAYWEKKLNFEAEKMIKKIAKLFDMCKDDKVNPLMAKISQKQSIVNPKLYDEYVAKAKSIKHDYKK